MLLSWGCNAKSRFLFGKMQFKVLWRSSKVNLLMG